ncbi:hypothetical protein GB937_007683 [Aspergillus fischeri]|nr:hypothetical protein GB937_007683 [Aspergillus fischeri]
MWCSRAYVVGVLLTDREDGNIKRSLEQEEISQVLVEHDADNQGSTHLMMAWEQGNSVIAADILYGLGIKWLAEMSDEEAECTTIFPFARGGNWPKQHCVYIDEPNEIKLTTGGPRRREIKNICFPNVSVSKLLEDEGETLARLEKLVERKGRTPLHYAAKDGHWEAVKLLSKYDCINVQARNNSGRRDMDLALDNDFYDVFNALQD